MKSSLNLASIDWLIDRSSFSSLLSLFNIKIYFQPFQMVTSLKFVTPKYVAIVIWSNKRTKIHN